MDNAVSGTLSQRLKTPLPGERAHRPMIPEGREYLRPLNVPKNARRAAVLIFITDTVQFTAPFIHRSNDDGPHSGQIALPGGEVEPGDFDEVDTALREAEEEIGLRHRDVIPLGTLSPLYIDVSNFLITPVVGVYSGTGPFPWEDLVPNIREVVTVHPVPICRLESTKKTRLVNVRGDCLVVPSYQFDGNVIWGATAMIIAEFVAVFADILNTDILNTDIRKIDR